MLTGSFSFRSRSLSESLKAADTRLSGCRAGPSEGEDPNLTLSRSTPETPSAPREYRKEMRVVLNNCLDYVGVGDE